MSTVLHLVIPGQVIASSSQNDDQFLRGHGTYVERVKEEDRLVAAVCGTVQRVNKLITVVPFSTSIYQGNVGDLVVGRVTDVLTTRWKVSLGQHMREAQLPLSGVHLPGGAQRVRTAQDQRDMRQYLQEGDLISAEVHKVQPSDGSLMLHTRSYRYSKLENGCLVTVPPSLIERRKNHFISMISNTLDVLWGCNGNIWIQRKLQLLEESEKEMAQLQETLRHEHSMTPVLPDERQSISRLRNAIECLRLVHCMVTPERAEAIYNKSVELPLRPADMLLPDNVIQLTESVRNSQ
jgi:exosome complex component RRP4